MPLSSALTAPLNKVPDLDEENWGLGLPPVTVATGPRHPCHGCRARSVEDFLTSTTARVRRGSQPLRAVETRPLRPLHGIIVCNPGSAHSPASTFTELNQAAGTAGCDGGV
ncbi:hypothetical protein B0H12DRAFT_1078730 [Mycena haematopus]|nr:hypothetical protein B0H12DRAFT_1078730 [Mycena haematopus]